jgi:hypothetical protein
VKENAKKSMKGGKNRKIRKWGFFVNSVPGQPEGYEHAGCFALATGQCKSTKGVQTWKAIFIIFYKFDILVHMYKTSTL